MEKAEAALIEILRANSTVGDAYHLLAIVQRALGKTARAHLTIERWLSVQPTNPEAWSRSAALYLSFNQSDMARNAFEQAAVLEPGEVTHWVGLATSALACQHWDEAVRSRDYLLENFGSHELAHLVDGHLHKFEGNLGRAAASYKKALELEPGLSSAIYNLVELDTPELDSSLTRQAEELNRQYDVSDSDSVNLEFALARICDKAGRFDEAFDHFERANGAAQQAARNRGLSYDRRSMEDSVTKTVEIYNSAVFDHPIDDISIQLKLVFIVGLPRSGTTLLEQILGSHPDVAPGGELTMAYDCLRAYVERRAELNLGRIINTSLPAEVSLLEEVRELYLDRLFEHSIDGAYITNKLPGNFEILGFIRLMFPKAIVVHSDRSLHATCWSLYSSNFGLHEPYCSSLEHLAHYCRMYQTLIQHWRTVLDPPMIKVRYEDVVTQPETVVPRLLSDVGLPWDERCLAFHENPRPVLTASYKQVRQPLYRSAVDKWRDYARHLSELSFHDEEWPG